MADASNISDADLRGTAYHEAGHCVAAIIHGQTIRYVTIIPGKRKNARGQVMVGRMLIRRPKLPQSTEQKQAELNGHLMGCYAGIICESAATGKPVEASSGADDHKAAVAMATALLGNGIDPATVQIALRGLYLQTLEFFTSQEVLRAVKGVANALIARRALTGGEVKRLVFQALLTPNIDLDNT